ncbi:arginase [Apiosordaria backusii]|uniref:Arginase n=1 Tax=Apiosordaria backusii TaxID=314023 RepID=A0AA40DWT6_9PEZI|nr:arginase [Apiosordaria backusii]
MAPSRLNDIVDIALPPTKSTSASATVTTTTLPNTPTSSVGSRTFGRSIMNTSLIESKFLSHPEDLGVVAVGFSGGQCKPGVDAAPSALIEAGLLTQIRDELGYNLHGHDTVHLYTDLVPKEDSDYRGMKNPRAVSAVTRKIADQVYNQAKEGRLVLTLGGDHSIAIGTIGGSAKAIRERLGREIAVIWVDAHADINTPETSGSGNIHGMPVSFLTGLAKEEKEDVFGWMKDENRISVKKIVYIGLRDVDAGEKKILRDNGIKAFSMFDIDRHGIGRVMEMALGHIGSDTPIHLSFDVDALDPMWAPSTGTPVRGGLTLREGDYICECVHETGSLVAVDLVEVNPSLAPANDIGAHETVRAGCSLVRCALGESLL